MADGTPITSEAVTPQEALLTHNTPKVDTLGMTPEQLKELEGLREQSPDKREFFQSIIEGKVNAPFTSERTENLALSFGGGKAKREKDGDPIKFDGDPGSVEARLFNEAQAEITSLQKFQQYAELLAKAQQKGISFEDYAKEAGVAGFEDIRTEALETILSDVLYSSIEGLDTMDPKDLQDLIDNHLVQDPAFRNELSNLLGKIKLPRTEITSNTEADVLNSKIGELDAQSSRALGEVETYLKSTIPDFDTKLGIDVKAKIEDYVKRGYNTEQILNELKFDLLPTKYFDKLTDYRSHEDEYKRLNETYQQLIKIDKTRNKDLYDSLNRSYTKDRNTWKAENAVLTKDPKYSEFQNITSALAGTKDGARFEGRAAQRIQELVGVKTQKDEAVAKKSISETTGNQAVSKNRDTRLEEERAAIAELRGVIPKAIAKTLLDRQEKGNAIRTKNEKAKFDAETNSIIDSIQTGMTKRGLGFETDEVTGRGKRLKDRGTITADAKMIALQKDSGLRDIGVELSGLMVPKKLDDGTIVMTGGKPEMVAAKSYSQLDERQKASFDKAFAIQKQALKVKIVTDLTASYGFLNKMVDFGKLGFGDKNSLNDTEWEELGKYASDSLRQVVSATQEGQRAIQQLEAAGIKPESKRGISILTLLGLLIASPIALAAFGGIGVVGAVGAGGIGAIRGATK